MKVYQIVLLVLVLIIGSWFVSKYFNKQIVYKQVEKEVILDNLTAKVNQLKGQLISEIKQCESAGYSEDYGLITFDPHKTNKTIAPASIGQFQWKVASVKYYYKSLYNKDITGKEAILIALDGEKSAQLTSDVIFKTDDGLSNWLTCASKNGSKAKLAVINSLLN